MRVYFQVEDIEEKLSYSPPENSAPATAVESGMAAKGVYIPVYSHVYTRGGKPVLLEATLSVRNTDPENDIILTSVNYYDSSGLLLKEYLNSAKKIAPLATLDFLVEEMDIKGGAGANFLISWGAEGLVNPPLFEAVMVGAVDDQTLAFTSRGVAVDR